MYKKGEGIKKNLTLALMWLDVASNKKNSFAIKMRKKIKKKMKPSDIQKSLELSFKSTDVNLSFTQNQLL